MSYKYETQYNSPNFTAAADAPKVWGRARTVDAIAIHWWGDPNTNPSYNGVINGLCSPTRGASAHFVATGTNRSVAQLVNLADASWATNSANPYTISIECDPRCRDEDYDVVAEVIAQIWDAYGYKPLVPHRQFNATTCPGNYDLARLEALAKTKDGSGDWGTVTNKEVAPPQPENLYRLLVDGNQVAAYTVEGNAYNGWVNYERRGRLTFNGQDVTDAIVAKYAPVKPEEPKPEEPETPTVPETPTEPSEPESPEAELPEKPTNTLWEDILALFAKLVEFLSKYKRSK